KIEKSVAVGIKGRAVIEQQRSAACQARHQPVPHHPSAGGEIEEAVAVHYAAMQTMFLEVLQQCAACRMDNAFRNPRGSGRIQYVKRVREGQPLKSQRFGCERGQRSEEHTSELQSRENLVCRLL